METSLCFLWEKRLKLGIESRRKSVKQIKILFGFLNSGYNVVMLLMQ